MEAVSSEDASLTVDNDPQDNLEASVDEDSEPDLESMMIRDRFTDPRTGRNRQLLICKLCGLRTQKLCNMRDHIRCHFSRKLYNCSICKRGFVQEGNRDRH